MSNAAKLKKKAAEFEQKRQYEKALALYVQALDESARGDAEPEVALYNRVGDLLLRLGNAQEAVGYYRKAVDLYAEGGYLNNAIALCNKILRHDPRQTEVHYTLGRISARKGFRSDAKFHFLEYAQRMQRAGQLDESFRALKEFADLCPDQDDIRLMLAEQLTKQGRSDEAVEQLQTLHERLTAEGRTVEARATAERMAAIDPHASPRMGVSASAPKEHGGLVFLDVSWEEPREADAARPRGAGSGVATAPAAPRTPPAPPAPTPVASILDAPEAPPADAPDHAAVAGLEPTALGSAPAPATRPLELDVEPPPDTEFGIRNFAPLPELLPPPVDEPVDLPGEAAASLPALEPPLDGQGDVEGSVGPELTFILPDDPAPAPAPAPGLELLPPLDAPVGAPPNAAPAAPSARPNGAAGPAIGNDEPAEAFVNLGDWLRDDEPPKSTRMVVDAVEPGEGEEFDFDDMLQKFKRGVAENVDADDHESHYDLGVAFREMGLVDEAIAEFQKALRGTKQRVRAYEALGQCFVDKQQHQVAASVLARAVAESPPDDQLLVGVLYLLGVTNEALGRTGDAIAFYQRVFAVDITFHDVEDRLSALERTTR